MYQFSLRTLLIATIVAPALLAGAFFWCQRFAGVFLDRSFWIVTVLFALYWLLEWRDRRSSRVPPKSKP
jgi:hypothetical protein